MPKGRDHAPSTISDGVWFQHRGLPVTGPPMRASSTTTGLMLMGPWHEEMRTYPPQPPRPYTEKDARNFKLSNNFSSHDNRHSFQDHGVYFGDGQASRDLGKRNTAPPLRQHYTDKEYLKHRGRRTVHYDYNTIYDSDYQGQPTEEPPTRRRFPRHHTEGTPGLAKLSTSTTDWLEDTTSEFRTPTEVLAVSQEPYLPANRWKYSYHSHGLSKCYPPYGRRENRNLYPSWAPSIPGRGPCAQSMPGNKMSVAHAQTVLHA